MRTAIVTMQDFKCMWGEDEYHLNKKKVMLVFTLEPSSYATVAIEALLANVDV